MDYQALKKWNSDTCHNINLENIMLGEITTKGQQNNNKRTSILYDATRIGKFRNRK